MSYIASKIRKNAYFDSVRLMRVAASVQKEPGILDAAIMVATDQNKEFLKATRLYTDEIRIATSSDLFLVVEAQTQEQAEQALVLAEERLERPSATTVLSDHHSVFYSLDSALATTSPNLAVISIPGAHVRREAMKCLQKGLHLFIFSDNVPIEDELAIKSRAQASGLLVMGPDCGTAIIQSIPLGFANSVRPGGIGIVGASGTGIQEISCLVDHLGGGISHCIGTGTNDISPEIKGISMLRGIELLVADPCTQAIVVISKPPAPLVKNKVIQAKQACGKDTVMLLLGAEHPVSSNHLYSVFTMEEAALTAVKLAEITPSSFLEVMPPWDAAEAYISRLHDEQKYVRGVFMGGTFTIEACLILTQTFGTVYTNTTAGKTLVDPLHSIAHTCVDMGSDLFTAGRPHPMLEPGIRNRRIIEELTDPETAVVLLDLVLGHGVHADPATELVQALKAARRPRHGRDVPVVASVCGTDKDPQERSRQVSILQAAGVLVFPSNRMASQAAAYICERRQTDMERR